MQRENASCNICVELKFCNKKTCNDDPKKGTQENVIEQPLIISEKMFKDNIEDT